MEQKNTEDLGQVVNDKLLYYFRKFGWVPNSGFGHVKLKIIFNDSKIVHVETKESHKIK